MISMASRSRWLLLSCTALLLLAIVAPAQAATGKEAATSGVVQSYNADPSVQVGMVVELKSDDPKTVTPLNAKRIKGMLGVVVPASQAAIVLTPEQVSKQQVLVANSGRYDLLVSNQNGPIGVGDYVTISAVAGVSMRAGDKEEQVIGKAAGNFSGTSNVIGSLQLKDSLGAKRSVSLGRVPVDIHITNNPQFHKSAESVPSILSKTADAVAGRPVSTLRIYASAGIFLVIAIITGNMLYGGIRGGFVAVGRNPLSKQSITKTLIQTVLAAVAVLIIGVFAVYLLLKL